MKWWQKIYIILQNKTKISKRGKQEQGNLNSENGQLFLSAIPAEV